MRHAYSAAAVRAAEKSFLEQGQGAVLMQRAALGLANSVMRQLRLRRGQVYGSAVTLLVGSGNNGGDALFAGAYLAARGVRVTALLTSQRTHAAGLAAFESAGGRFERAHDGSQAFYDEVASCDLVIDGLVGIGGSGMLRPELADIVARMCQIRCDVAFTVVACDLPSGIDATTGQGQGPILPADVTVTFGALKAGLLLGPAEQLCGAVELVDIGLSVAELTGASLRENGTEAILTRLESADLGHLLPSPSVDSQKYSRGVAGIVAGSPQYPGAALLAVAAASACGPGMVRYLGEPAVASSIHQRNPEVVYSEERPETVHVQAWLVGPGIDGSAEQKARALEAMASGLPTVVDAGALQLFASALLDDFRSSGPHTENRSESQKVAINARSLILTPHAGELSALLETLGEPLARDEVEAFPLAAAQKASELTGATVLLKGPSTVIVGPSGTVFSQADGNARLATAGSGDTLAGILVALLAMHTAKSAHFPGVDPADTLAVTGAIAAALHGRLAHRDPKAPLNAGMLAARIPEVWADLVESADAKQS